MSLRVLLRILVPSVWLLGIICAKDDLATSYDIWNTVIYLYSNAFILMNIHRLCQHILHRVSWMGLVSM